MAPIKVCFLLLTLAAGNDVDSCAASPEGCPASSDTDPNTLLQSRVSAHVAVSTDALNESLVDGWKKTCKEYTCPSGFKAKDTPPVRGCDDEYSCNFNCCDWDINGNLERRNSVLTLAVLVALQNVTGFANDIQTPRLHSGSDHDIDVALVQDSVAGLFLVMRLVLQDKADKVCPLDDYTKIRVCLSSAICVIEKNLQAKPKEMEAYSLIQEYMVKFETVTWPQLMDILEQTDPQDVAMKKIGYRDPDELSCRGYDLVGSDAKLMESGSSSDSSALSDAYHTSTALINAAKATHRILDAHTSNTSLDVTVKALHGAWEHPCKLLNCDHTNYWDFVGASYSHSVALLESGASAEHMRSHVQTRARLDHRVQHFMGYDGVSVVPTFFRREGTHTDAHATRYGSVVIGGLRHVLTSLPEGYGIHAYLFSLFDRQKLKTFVDKPGQPSLVDAFLNNQVVMAHGDQTSEQINSDKHNDEMSGGDRAQKKHQEHRVILTQWGPLIDLLLGSGTKEELKHAPGGGVDLEKELNNYDWGAHFEKVLKAFAKVLTDLLSCLGVSMMRFQGYGLRICATPTGFTVGPACPPTHMAGVAVTLSISTTNTLEYLMNVMGGNAALSAAVPNSAVSVGISVCAGLIPGSGETGGMRAGLGISLTTTVNPHKSEIKMEIGLAAVALAVSKGSGKSCPLGPAFGVFKCLAGGGIVAKLLCCAVIFKPGPVKVQCGNKGGSRAISDEQAKKLMTGNLKDGLAGKLAGEYYIRHKVNNRMMDAWESGGYTAVTRPAQGNDSQKWVITPKQDGAYYEVIHKVNARYLDAWEGSSHDYRATTTTAQKNDSQRWIITKVGEDVYTIQQKVNRRYLDAYESGDYTMTTRPRQGNDSQKWIITAANYVQAYLVRSGVECKSGSTSLGRKLTVQQCADAVNGAGGQYFIFGTGGKAGSCWTEKTGSSSCPEGWQTDQYNFYSVQGPVMVNKGGSGCTGSKKCDVCQGDCDRDSDCATGLKCFLRNKYETPPGCTKGGSGDKKGYDYCYKPTMKDYGQGYCSNDYLRGWDGKGTASQAACNAVCMAEVDCTYAAWYGGKTCSRYKGKDCHLNGNRHHYTYAKREAR